jgi:hypothetical protein
LLTHKPGLGGAYRRPDHEKGDKKQYGKPEFLHGGAIRFAEVTFYRKVTTGGQARLF